MLSQVIPIVGDLTLKHGHFGRQYFDLALRVRLPIQGLLCLVFT